MITSLLIDDVEYKTYLLFDETNRLKFQIDEGINSLISPIYEFSLDNRDGLEETFLKNHPYEMFGEGHVKLYNDGVKRFDGYIDKENSKIFKNAVKLDIYAISLDKKIGVDLAEYDITQLYNNKDESIPVRQRGGREGITVRYDWEAYHKIEYLISTMLEDIGVATGIISYASRAWGLWLRYRYNEEKFGSIADRQTIGVYKNWGDRGWNNPYFNRIMQFVRNETDTESYDSLMKEFAKIAGCIYFYDPQTDAFHFVERNSQFGTTLNIDQLMLYSEDDEAYEIPIKYKNSYNGLIIEFDDLSLLLKIDKVAGELVFTYGIDAQEYDITWLIDGYFLQKGADVYALGTHEFLSSLYIENGLKVKMNSNFVDYFYRSGPPYTGMNRVDNFMQAVYNNYGYTLIFDKEIEVKLNGLFFPPFIASLNGRSYGCWYGETDFNTEETLIRLEISEFEPVIPEESLLLMEDDSYILDG